MQATTSPERLSIRDRQRAEFAAQACREEFTGRALSLAREPSFQDRRPRRVRNRFGLISGRRG